jgi:hypothetical protein
MAPVRFVRFANYEASSAVGLGLASPPAPLVDQLLLLGVVLAL